MTSLHELITRYQTKGELLEALQPSVRRISLDNTSKRINLEANIKSVLSMTLQAIQQHEQFIEFQMVVGKQKDNSSLKIRKIKLPHYGKPSKLCEYNIRNMAILLTLLRTIQERISLEYTSTVRDIYYSNVELYRVQSTVSHWLKIISTNFKLKEINMLNIVPAQKGLVYSTIPLECDKILKEGEVHLIPYINENSVIKLTIPETSELIIRIFEKEAIFNKIIQYLNGVTRKEIIITGKGYPDTLTKTLVHRLNHLLPLNDLLVYVDADPYGINIVLSYLNNCPTVSRVKYKGVSISQLINKGGQLLSMTIRDYCMARTTLARVNQHINSSKTSLETNNFIPLKQELQRQLFFGKKGEMNVIYV